MVSVVALSVFDSVVEGGGIGGVSVDVGCSFVVVVVVVSVAFMSVSTVGSFASIDEPWMGAPEDCGSDNESARTSSAATTDSVSWRFGVDIVH